MATIGNRWCQAVQYGAPSRQHDRSISQELKTRYMPNYHHLCTRNYTARLPVSDIHETPSGANEGDIDYKPMEQDAKTPRDSPFALK